MKFKLNPLVFAVRRAMEELPRSVKLEKDAQPPRKIMARKKPAYWNRNHITRLADALFPTMLNEVHFPIGMDDRISLCKRAEAAQLTCFKEEERGVITTERREKLIAALNYRYKRHLEAQLQATTPTKAEKAAVTVVDNTANEMGQVVGAYLSSDPENMKSFMTGLLSAFASK